QTRSEATEILRLLNGRLARVQIGGTKQTIPGKLPHGMTTRSGCLQPSAITRKSHHKPNSMPPATAGPSMAAITGLSNSRREGPKGEQVAPGEDRLRDRFARPGEASQEELCRRRGSS